MLVQDKEEEYKEEENKEEENGEESKEESEVSILYVYSDRILIDYRLIVCQKSQRRQPRPLLLLKKMKQVFDISFISSY